MAMSHPSVNFRLSYVDFAPRCLGAGGVICSPDYERFDCMMARANEWLRRNGHLKVMTCESIEVKGRYDGVVDTNKSSYFEADHTKRKMRNMYIRALRLWVLPKGSNESLESQQIGYVNVIPARNDYGTFDSFGDTVRKFNIHLRQRPLPGRIINIESQEMKFHEWGVGVDPDESCWVESVKFNVSFLVVIRLFYSMEHPAYEEIGCADFVPSCTDVGSQFASTTFETFGEVVAKASGWVGQQMSVRITNIQSIDYKLQHGWEGGTLDTQRSFYVESGRHTTKYLRILRICFVKPFHEPLSPRPPLLLNYVTFEPQKISSGGITGIPLYESMADTMKRAMVWLNRNNNARVIAAETVPVRMFSGNQFGNHEATYTWNRGEQKEFWLLVLRLFLDGEYYESPLELFPPAEVAKRRKEKQHQRYKEQHKSNCCALL